VLHSHTCVYSRLATRCSTDLCFTLTEDTVYSGLSRTNAFLLSLPLVDPVQHSPYWSTTHSSMTKIIISCFHVLNRSDQRWGSLSFLSNSYQKPFPVGRGEGKVVDRPRREADNSFPSVKNAWNYISAPPCVMPCCLIKHRGIKLPANAC
jgi:hypothetical protein